MSNTPCAYAVDSVLHRRVEIKVGSSHCGGILRINLIFTPWGLWAGPAKQIFLNSVIIVAILLYW